MFTVREEAIINLKGKLKQEMEQSPIIANMSEGSWESQPETVVCYCWALQPSVEPGWS